ncbi:hypothetical protein J1614_012276 [Plenodomus biglobosus]|nr:hypothetical protein J1614_012276 [Plenodomus biglobosus]
MSWHRPWQPQPMVWSIMSKWDRGEEGACKDGWLTQPANLAEQGSFCHVGVEKVYLRGWIVYGTDGEVTLAQKPTESGVDGCAEDTFNRQFGLCDQLAAACTELQDTITRYEGRELHGHGLIGTMQGVDVVVASYHMLVGSRDVCDAAYGAATSVSVVCTGSGQILTGWTGKDWGWGSRGQR